jgi:predicted O-linked N-acetylglucosamine transferase (SPINDLY family)
VEQITEDKIHILVNLGGYTKAARNDIFATRPCPVQVSLMGYAATSGAGQYDVNNDVIAILTSYIKVGATI